MAALSRQMDYEFEVTLGYTGRETSLNKISLHFWEMDSVFPSAVRVTHCEGLACSLC
jgi:hypothetical protein